MPVTTANAYFGLTALANPTRSNVSGVATIGRAQEALSLTSLLAAAGTPVAYSVRLTMGKAATATLDLTTGVVTGATAGTAHVETATAAGTATGNGNVTVTITGSNYPSANKVITVAILNAETASAWAAKVRAALTADADISADYTVGGAGADIVLTQKVAGGDDSINIALTNGTPSPGITPAATSTSTTSGVPRVIVEDATYDFEGNTVPTLDDIFGFMLVVDGVVEVVQDAGAISNFGVLNGNTEYPAIRLHCAGLGSAVSNIADPLEFETSLPATNTIDIIVIGTTV